MSWNVYSHRELNYNSCCAETTLNNLNRIRSYRMFSNEHRKVEMNGFIDGDFVEMFIDMTVEEQKSIVKDIDVS